MNHQIKASLEPHPEFATYLHEQLKEHNEKEDNANAQKHHSSLQRARPSAPKCRFFPLSPVETTPESATIFSSGWITR